MITRLVKSIHGVLPTFMLGYQYFAKEIEKQRCSRSSVCLSVSLFPWGPFSACIVLFIDEQMDIGVQMVFPAVNEQLRKIFTITDFGVWI